MPISEDAIYGAACVEDLANTCAIPGEYDLAIDQLEYLLLIPSDVFVPYLKIRPGYAALRDHPRFQALLEKYGGGDRKTDTHISQLAAGQLCF